MMRSGQGGDKRRGEDRTPRFMDETKFGERLLNRFWSMVEQKENNDCWIWKGSKFNSGYGRFTVKGVSILAHRFIYFLYHKEHLDFEDCICHHCDTRLCVNPRHLFKGTRLDNVRDMDSKGRGNRYNFHSIYNLAIKAMEVR